MGILGSSAAFTAERRNQVANLPQVGSREMARVTQRRERSVALEASRRHAMGVADREPRGDTRCTTGQLDSDGETPSRSNDYGALLAALTRPLVGSKETI